MEYLVILIFIIIIYLMLMFIFGVNIKKLKNIAEDKELDELIKKYPENITICKEYLKMLNNENVNIEEDNNSNSTLYLITGNKIFIANLKDSYTRIQTIAHECLHSIQSKKILWFNFIFSNIYIIFFIIICILAVMKILPQKMIFLVILASMGAVFYFVRSYLEIDAMTKARFLAKEYMNKKSISTNEEIEKIVSKYDEINDLGIKITVFQLFGNTLLKLFIFALICFLTHY